MYHKLHFHEISFPSCLLISLVPNYLIWYRISDPHKIKMAIPLSDRVYLPDSPSHSLFLHWKPPISPFLTSLGYGLQDVWEVYQFSQMLLLSKMEKLEQKRRERTTIWLYYSMRYPAQPDHLRLRGEITALLAHLLYLIMLKTVSVCFLDRPELSCKKAFLLLS